MNVTTIARLFQVALCLLGGLPMTLGQSPSKLRSNLPKIPVAISNSRLQVSLKGALGMQTIVGIKASLGAAPHAAIGIAQLRSIGSGRAALLGMLPFPPDHYTAEPGNLLIDAAAVNQGGTTGLLVYAAVPPNTRVTCVLDRTVVADTVVADSLMIRNGTVLDEPIPSFSRVVVRLLSPKTPPQPPLTRLQDGNFVASKDALHEHLISGGDISTPVSSADPCECTRSGLLFLTIDKAGQVASVKTGGADETIAALAAGQVQRWQFRPFSYEGQPIAVRATIPIIKTKSGSLRVLW